MVFVPFGVAGAMAASFSLFFFYILYLCLQVLGPGIMHLLIIYHFWTFFRVFYLPKQKVIPHPRTKL